MCEEHLREKKKVSNPLANHGGLANVIFFSRATTSLGRFVWELTKCRNVPLRCINFQVNYYTNYYFAVLSSITQDVTPRIK